MNTFKQPAEGARYLRTFLEVHAARLRTALAEKDRGASAVELAVITAVLVGLAVAICVTVAVALRVIGDELPQREQEGLETIVGVIDWERAGPASPAFDLARWEVSAGDGLHDRSDLLRRGYARVADPDSADAGWVPAFAIDWALEVLGWKNPAPPARLRRCVDVVARYADA